MSRVKYYVFDDATGGTKETDYQTFLYFVNEFGVTRNDKHGNTFWPETNRKLPARETVHAYNPQGILIAEKDF